MRIPGVIDVQTVRDPEMLRSIASDRRLGRVAVGRGPFVNRLISRMAAGLFRANGKVLPSGRDPDDAQRLDMRDALIARIKDPALAERLNTPIADAAAYVAGGPGEKMWLTQNILGTVVLDSFVPNDRTVLAAHTIGAVLNGGILRQMADWVSGQSAKARGDLSRASGGDLNAVHTLGIAAQNFAASLEVLRDMPAETRTEAAMAKALVVPQQVLRQGREPAETLATSVQNGTLVILKTAEAARRTLDPRDAFLAEAWSGCPADGLVPQLLHRIWLEAGGAP